jgi:hypothetical protein
MAFVESAAAGVCFGTADSITDDEKVAAWMSLKDTFQRKG